MKQTLLSLCENAIIEKDTNKLSLIGLFDNISSSNVPVIIPRFTVFTRFEDGKDQHKHNIKIIHEESGDIVAELPGEISFGPNGKAQYIGNFVGLPFSKFGKYKIQISIDGSQFSDTVLDIIKK